MEQLFIDIAKQLDALESLAWIDLDYGQAEDYTLRPAVAFPAALINVSFPALKNITHEDREQTVEAQIIVRVVFDRTGTRSSEGTQEKFRRRSLAFMRTAQEAYETLQGYEPDGWEALEGSSLEQERRTDGLLAMRMVFKTRR